VTVTDWPAAVVPPVRWAEAVYPAAEQFAARCLRQGLSLFADDIVWTIEAAGDFHNRFVVQEDLSDATFMQKLDGQLANAPRETVLLAADIVYVNCLAVHDMKRATKLARIEGVLGLLPDRPPVTGVLADALDMGIASFGQANTQVWLHVRYLAEFARDWARLGPERHDELLSDPWGFKAYLSGLASFNPIQMSALQHLLFPSVFEPIVSVNIKEKVAKAFAGLSDVSGESDVDKKVATIRAALTPVLGDSFQFYESPAEPVWAGGTDRPAWEFARFARMIREVDDFDEHEINYKHELARRLAKAREAVLSNREWLPALKRAFASPNNLTSWRQHGTFLTWCETAPDAARAALVHAWSGHGSDADCEAFLEAVPDEAIGTPGARANILSYLLMGLDPQSRVIYKPTAANRALTLCGDELPETADVLGRIRSFENFLDQLRVRVVALGGPAVSRLESQGMAWWVAESVPPEQWSDSDQAALIAFREQRTGGPPTPVVAESQTGRALALPQADDEFAARLHLPQEWLQDTIDLLSDKGQVIFYGPPGTGKTYVARELARHLVQRGGASQIVQFHPSYSYEDFFEGYRPSEGGDTGVAYALKSGPLKRWAEAARDDPAQPYVLIVDEINRGNIPKIFGELLFLLEYRDEAVELQYGKDQFSLPENLLLMGTMNTADRSIALVDAALRRRFFFIPFMPTEEPVAGVLRSWLKENERDELPALLLDELNRRIAKDEVAIGPSYLMSGDGSRASLESIWRHAILPLLDEHYYGTKVNVHTEFGLEACLDAVKGGEPRGVDDEGEGALDTNAATPAP
jgi:5-methylcytosine-specific restriction protein B